MSPDVLGSAAVQGLKSQLAGLETKLTEASAIVGKNHPTRVGLEAQIGALRQQIAAETRRVAGGTSTSNRGSGQKVAELQAMVDAQKKQVLSLRSDRDQIGRLPARCRLSQAGLRRGHPAPGSDQSRRVEQPGQHAVAEPGRRAAGAVEATGGGRHPRCAARRPRGRVCSPPSASSCATVACAFRKT